MSGFYMKEGKYIKTEGEEELEIKSIEHSEYGLIEYVEYGGHNIVVKYQAENIDNWEEEI